MVIEPKPDDECGLKVAVIGAGPAGLSAAYHLRLRGYEVSLYDAEKQAGGLLRSGIPAYRLPRESLNRDIERILNMGIDFCPNQTLGKNLFVKDLLEGGFQAVFLAIGAQKGTALPVEQDDWADRSGVKRDRCIGLSQGGEPRSQS